MIASTVPERLFGPLLLVDRASYRRVGGHAAVRDRILENYWLAGQFRAAGIPVRSAIGKGVFSFRMYPNGWRELVDGWTKGFASGAGQTPRGTLFLVVAWMTGLMQPGILWLAEGNWFQSGALYLLGAAQVAWFSRLAGSFRWSTALFYPVPLAFFFAVFARSALRSGRTVQWKGRAIRAD
jgi:4,4'-diaponeurosporenoate glycosyltransferase